MLSAALTAGVAVSGLIMFFAVGYNPKSLRCWGNTVSSADIDGSSKWILPTPAKGTLILQKEASHRTTSIEFYIMTIVQRFLEYIIYVYCKVDVPLSFLSSSHSITSQL
jgi:hypothetical protein